MDLRDQYDAQQLERQRLALALRRGSQHASVLRESHPGRYLAGGLGVAVLATIAAGIVGLVAPRAPEGWDDPGRLVLDATSGQRYVVDGRRALRPLPNETSVRLVQAGGAAPSAVSVADRFVREAPRGETVGRSDVPVEPPALLPADASLQRCQVGAATVVVAGAAPVDGPGAALLVRRAGALLLLADGRAHPTDPVAAGQLGYPVAQAVDVAPVVLEAVPAGPPLVAVPLPPPADPALPPLQREGALVTGVPSGASYVVLGGVLRPVPGRTALQLVFGPQPPVGEPVPDAAIATAPRGEPVVPAGVPEVPPPLAPVGPGAAVCVDAGGAVRVLPGLPARAAPGAAPEATAVPPEPTGLVTPTGQGLLLATSPEAVERTSERAPLLLVTGDRTWPITSPSVLAALGYRADQVRVVSPELTALAPAQAPLQAIEVS